MKTAKGPIDTTGGDSPAPPSLNLDERIPSTGSQYGSVEPHIFTDSLRAEHWRGVYEGSKYECRHRFDPSFQWTAKEEKKALRKVNM